MPAMICFLLAVAVAGKTVTFAPRACAARRETPAQVYKEKAYHEAVAARNASLASVLAGRKFETTPKSWYLIEPEYSCDVDLRVGAVVGDGARFVCNPHHIQQQDQCLYYGFGINNIVFEQALRTIVDCEMHTFDARPTLVTGATPGRLAAMGIDFHNWSLSGVDEKVKIGSTVVHAFTLDTIRTKLGHAGRTIDILKIDIEGSEWASLATMLRGCNPQHPVAHQILVELHAGTQQRVTTLYDDLARCGYRTFHKDPNLYASTCMEYAFVHWHFLKCM